MGLKKAFRHIVDKLTRSERARNRSAKKHEESAARRRGPGITINEPDPVPRRASVSYQPPAAAYETPSSGDEAQSDDGVEYMIQEWARTPTGKAIIDEDDIDDSDKDDDEDVEHQGVPPGYNAEMEGSQTRGGPSSSQPRMDYIGLGTGYYHDDHGSSSGGFHQHRDHDYADAWAPDMGGGYAPPHVCAGDPIWDEQFRILALQGGEALEDSPELELVYQLLRRPTIK